MEEEARCFGIYSLNSPTAVIDACIVYNFEGNGRSVLVIARGPTLQFAYPEDGNFKVRKEYTLFGNAVRIIPIQSPTDPQPNILAILADRRFVVLKYNEGIVAVQTGNICSSKGTPVDPTFKVKYTSHGILIQFFHKVIQYFRYLPNSCLSTPYNCVVSAKSIIDFDFLGSCEDRPKIVALVKDYCETDCKLQVYDGDDLNQVFTLRENSILRVRPDTYKIAAMENSIVALATNCAYRVTFHAVAAPAIESSSIYTSHPIVHVIKLAQNLYLAADKGNNVMTMFFGEGGAVKINRVGGVNVPVALLPIFESRQSYVLSIAATGMSSRIDVAGRDDGVIAMVSPVDIQSSSINKLIEAANSEFVGLCGNNSAQVIVSSLIVEKEFAVSMPGVTGVWFAKNNEIVISFAQQTKVARIDPSVGIRPITYPDIIETEQTLAFGMLDRTRYVQVTPSVINFAGQEPQSRQRILCASIYNGFTSIVCCDRGDCQAQVINYNGEVIFSESVPSGVISIASDGVLVAVASWSHGAVMVYNLESGEIVRRIDNECCISVALTEEYLVLAETHDWCSVYSLAKEENIYRIRCDGIHYGLVAVDTKMLIVAGETPKLLDGTVMKGVTFDGFKYASISGSSMVIITNEKLNICHCNGFAMAVHNRTLANNIIDAIPAPDSARSADSLTDERSDDLPSASDATQSNDADTDANSDDSSDDESPPAPDMTPGSTNFIVVAESTDGVVIGIADHPLTAQIEDPHELSHELGSFVGLAAISNSDLKLVAVLFTNNLILFEYVDHTLQQRSVMPLKFQPFCIEAFNNQHFILGYRRMFQLYSPDVISCSVIELRKVCEVLTQGSAVHYSCDDDMVAVADELESIVLFAFNKKDNKFMESARNCVSLRPVMCRMRGDDYFCVDKAGAFSHLSIARSKNVESSDLAVTFSGNISQSVVSMVLFQEELKLIAATSLGQYVEIVLFKPSQEFEVLYGVLENHIRTIGNAASLLHRTVMRGSIVAPGQTMYNLDLLNMFTKLAPEQKEGLAKLAEMTVEDAMTICAGVLSNV